MTIRTVDPTNFDQEARRIRAGVSTVMKKWGLLPRFKRWRLTKDPETGIIVLFGILNNEHIAMHTSIAFSDYFHPRVLHDLANQLQVQVVSCNTDGLRYAFVLDRGRLGSLPTHIDYPYVDNGKLAARVVYRDSQQYPVTSPAATGMVDDHSAMRRAVRAFLKAFEDIQLRNEAVSQLSAQATPDIVLIDEDEFNRRVAEHEVDRRRSKHIRELFDETAG